MLVLDTNVVSELVEPSPAPAVLAFFRRRSASDLYVTTVTEAELQFGVACLPEARDRRDVSAAIEQILRDSLAGRILPFDRASAQAYARIAASRRAVGRHVSRADVQIASIATSNGMAVATRNAGHFEGPGVSVVNPWVAT